MALILAGGTEPHKFHECIHQLFVVGKMKCAFFSSHIYVNNNINSYIHYIYIYIYFRPPRPFSSTILMTVSELKQQFSHLKIRLEIDMEKNAPAGFTANFLFIAISSLT